MSYDVDDFLERASSTDVWITRSGVPRVHEDGKSRPYCGITTPLSEFVWPSYVRPRTLKSSSSLEIGNRVDKELQKITILGKRRREGDGETARRRKRKYVERRRQSPPRERTRSIDASADVTTLGVSLPKTARLNARPPDHYHTFTHAIVHYAERAGVELVASQVCVRYADRRILTFIDMVGRRVRDGAIVGIELKTGYDAGIEAPTKMRMRHPFRNLHNTALNQFFIQLSVSAELARRDFGFSFDALEIWRVNRTPTLTALRQIDALARRKTAKRGRRGRRRRRMRSDAELYGPPLSSVVACERRGMAFVHVHPVPDSIAQLGPSLLDHIGVHVEASRRSRRRPTRVVPVGAA